MTTLDKDLTTAISTKHNHSVPNNVCCLTDNTVRQKKNLSLMVAIIAMVAPP